MPPAASFFEKKLGKKLFTNARYRALFRYIMHHPG